MKKWSHAHHHHGLPLHEFHPAQSIATASLTISTVFRMSPVNSHNLHNGHCPFQPKTCSGYIYRGHQCESVHFTGESTPLSVLLLFFRRNFTLLVVEANRHYQERLQLFDDGHSHQTNVTESEIFAFLSLTLQIGHTIQGSLEGYLTNWSRFAVHSTDKQLHAKDIIT